MHQYLTMNPIKVYQYRTNLRTHRGATGSDESQTLRYIEKKHYKQHLDSRYKLT